MTNLVRFLFLCILSFSVAAHTSTLTGMIGFTPIQLAAQSKWQIVPPDINQLIIQAGSGQSNPQSFSTGGNRETSSSCFSCFSTLFSRSARVDPEGLLQRELIFRFVKALEPLEEYLKQNPDINLLLVFDIDNTLVHLASTFTDQRLNGVQRLIYFVHNLQMNWFYHLNALKQKYPNLLLVYNTARDAGLSLQNQTAVTAFTYPRGLEHRHFERLPLQPMLDAISPDHPYNTLPISLPVPDAIIFGAGLRIELNKNSISNHFNEVETHLRKINEKLDSWANTDASVISESLQPIIEQYPAVRIASNNAKNNLFLNHLTPYNLTEELFTHNFSVNYPQILMSPLASPNGIVRSVMFTNVTLNKGTGLRILIKLMNYAGIFRGKKTLMAIFGDGHADIPMFRPDREAEAVAPLSDTGIYFREERLASLSELPMQSMDLSWILSLVFNLEHIRSHSTDHIKRALNHQNIAGAPFGLGVLNAMEELGRRLTRPMQEDAPTVRR